MLLSFSQNTILGEQVYGPYGASRYMVGNITTAKGYTGQFHDAVSGLDYYNARYYDPVVGRFLSVDSVQGNMLGFDPYAYVSGNPETMSDPTGHWGWGDTFMALGAIIAVAAIVTIAAIAATVLVTAGATLLAGAGIEATGAAMTATVAASADLAVDTGVGAGLGALGGEVGLATSGQPVSDQDIWSTAAITGAWGALWGLGGSYLAGMIPEGAGWAMRRLAANLPTAAQTVGGITGGLMTNAMTAHGAEVTPADVAKTQKEEDTQAAKALHMSYNHYKKFQHANAVALDRQFADEQQHYVQRWHAFLSSMRSQSHGSAYTPRQEAMINQWRHAYYA